MSKKVRVSKIKIEIGNNEFELSLDQARELRDILNETLGRTVIEREIIERPVYRWPYTYWATSSNSVAAEITSGTVTYSLTASDEALEVNA